jgi:hypothetical protein
VQRCQRIGGGGDLRVGHGVVAGVAVQRVGEEEKIVSAGDDLLVALTKERELQRGEGIDDPAAEGNLFSSVD